MAVNVSNPQDLTGRIKAQREAEVADQKREAAQRMSMVTAQAEQVKSGVTDLTSAPSEQDGVVVAQPTKKLRVNTTLEQVTIGHGTEYNFEVGRIYKVDQDVYNYLDERGFVWH